MLDKLDKGIIDTNDLTVRQPETATFLFDPRKNILYEDWEQIKKSVEIYRGDWEQFVYYYFIIKTLNPDFNLDITDEEKNKIKTLVDIFRENSIFQFIRTVPFLKNIDSEFNWGITDADKEKMKSYLKSRQGITFLISSANLKILDPNYDWGIADTDIAEIIKAFAEEKRDWGVVKFRQLVNTLKILNPDIDLGIIDSNWKQIIINNRTEPNRTRVNWYGLTQFFFSLALSSAKNIIFDEKGMHLVFEEESIEEENPKMPKVI